MTKVFGLVRRVYVGVVVEGVMHGEIILTCAQYDGLTSSLTWPPAAMMTSQNPPPLPPPLPPPQGPPPTTEDELCAAVRGYVKDGVWEGRRGGISRRFDIWTSPS